MRKLILLLILTLFPLGGAFGSSKAVYDRQRGQPTAYTDEIKHGAKTVTSAGTAEAIASTTSCSWVTIQAKRANTGRIYVGGASVPNDDTGGLYLLAGDSVTLDVTDLAMVYINSTVSAEGVIYVYSR